MNDVDIVELYLNRSEAAIKETAIKYGTYCNYIAYNILFSKLDAEECVDDTYLNVWNSIPPHIPANFKYFVGSICRNISLNRCDFNKAQKRNSKMEIALEELCGVADSCSINFEDEIDLKNCINKFLSTLSKKNRNIFMRRYWYFASIKEIAEGMLINENSVKVMLHRMRLKLQKILKKEGFIYDK